MGLKIYAVGDIMLGEQKLCNNFGVKSIIKKNGADYLFKDTFPLFNDGDIVFGNLESSITDRNTVSKNDSFFCADPSAIPSLKKAHFNILSIANNHIMEHGQISFYNTIQILKENGITPIGIRNKTDILSIDGVKVAFLAYSFIADNMKEVCYNKIRTEKTIIEDIKKVKSRSNIIIISLHWGYEYTPYPSPDQIRIGRTLVDSGADIVLGGHPHVTQSYEIYKNRPIFYSLGNFIFDDTYIPTTQKSIIAAITINNSLNSFEVTIIPVQLDKENYQPRLITNPSKRTSLDYIETIRKKIENQSLDEYTAFVGNYNILSHKFNQMAKWDMKIQFIKNFYRYSASTIFTIIKQYFRKTAG
jgi:poly-gamma-glutamate synthesis protein (capsule biosynthesis protein)